MLGKVLAQSSVREKHHSTIGITPYEALFHHKPSFGLSDLGIPSEIASDIHTEQDLECVIDEINAATADDSKMMPDDPSDDEYPPHVTSQTFPIIDLPMHSGQHNILLLPQILI